MRTRCPWANVNTQMQTYHDTEWGVPCHKDSALFEYVLLDSFQAGLSWATILRKRENFRTSFDDFDVQKIANYQNAKVEKLLQDSGIIRHRGKIEATTQNANVFLNIQKEFGSFGVYLWNWMSNQTKKNLWEQESNIPSSTADSDAISKDLKKRGFRFFGTTICYAFMQGAGLVNDHLVSCFRYHEV
ncbi:MAG: DNA-3-methyladenine glycosylase [Candidatus Wildermuthbacteria bacterium RIFCSPHIGHO2_12_FULL_45_9]|uniref:DNA-3-methyladenine glycosylase n=1 Tax=Candidatus Wildermuthbacteria bacterium RIFCSPHIGHO2_02_FULL_45_25 TaxID=1802450 RepID=A0A1G2QYJ1_9BACT|nr:MAG: DNA-3-methyladenine glycosylase [Candidatus Wildermuthbacteria bacterium RIFCSPHIGHO2_01_FULL_45_20]OHA65704.1 MAG: DNA-3-methyladenine glycosylase [Candidatus Wildermuthbacteria bacterium RIFCSPHIGHO2_02_FULL_45_25]OHA70259.1 MAG: DNA-3-methyladenine glycosylase [Candidatus Wildermuthbacteria bacterium RIFCSPHIGHO2_12_FULL_45_9]